MSPSWHERRLVKRVKPGDGRPLKPIRWWQMTRRSVMSIALLVDGRQVMHTIEVKHGGDVDTGVVEAGLYLGGQLRAQSKVPARFPVVHGHLEVRTSQVGLRRCHFVAHDGTERRLVPDPKSAEGRRMRFAHAHPLASGFISAVSVLVLLIGEGLNMLQAAEPISEIPLIAGKPRRQRPTLPTNGRNLRAAQLKCGRDSRLSAVVPSGRVRRYACPSGVAATSTSARDPSAPMTYKLLAPLSIRPAACPRYRS